MTQPTALTIGATSGEEFTALMQRVETAATAFITGATDSTPLLAAYNGNSELRIIVLWFNTSALEALRALTGKPLADGRSALDAVATSAVAGEKS